MPPAEIVVAVIQPCEQYRFRVELPETLDDRVRDEINRRVYHEATETFIECTRKFQSIGWVGPANLAFIDSRHSPSDSRSQFLHILLVLKMIELSHLHHRGLHEGKPDRPVYIVEFQTNLRWAARKEIERLCDALGLKIRHVPDGDGKLQPMARMGGSYRSVVHGRHLFARGPINRIEALRNAVMHRLAAGDTVKRCVNVIVHGLSLPFWPFAIAARAVFTLRYRAAAIRLMRRMDGDRNLFVYFDIRMGRNRDVPSYLRWKFGSAFARQGSAPIAFSHFARPCNAYSLAAMCWAHKTLKRMEKQPLDGCIIVNYLISPVELLKLRFRRNAERKRAVRALRAFRGESRDFVTRLVYSDFIATLDHTHAFAMEVSQGYQEFFAAFSPGVVVQADSVTKSSRYFTACARRLGGRAIYVADRICTELRTSNRFITDDGDNPHIPDRFVVFDQVTAEEFTRQGVAADHIHHYDRKFSIKPAAVKDGAAGSDQVVIYLQAYGDNPGAMVGIGVEIARAFPGLEVIYQEHPNFPVCDRAKSKLLADWPGRLRFLEPREPVEYHRSLALITGYSTAVVPGVLAGVPLIWMRRQIDNSIYGESCMNRIGFPADSPMEILEVLKRLFAGDAATAEACAGFLAAAKEIFSHSNPRGLAEVLDEAIRASFAEIHPA